MARDKTLTAVIVLGIKEEYNNLEKVLTAKDSLNYEDAVKAMQYLLIIREEEGSCDHVPLVEAAKEIKNSRLIKKINMFFP